MQMQSQFRKILSITLASLALAAGTGCAVNRGQESVGAYVDDATITTRVKTRFAEDKRVDATAIKVETLNGTVMLSGFARNSTEQQAAQMLASEVPGVKSVRNAVIVRP